MQRERAKRAAQLVDAQEELKRGDAAYNAENFQAAVDSYAKARNALGNSFVTGELHDAATLRFAQASVERARQLAKVGDREQAEAMLDTVLAEGVLPSYQPARQLKEQIHDPIRYNPALTPDHVRDVDEVRRNLYEAEGFYNLGQFDRSLEMYQAVLRIDPTNTAARRGMERLSKERSEYYRAAYDETRQRMFTELGKMWETPVPPESVGDGGMGLIEEEGFLARSAEEKLRSIIVPTVDLDGVNLVEAAEFLRQRSIELDTLELDENRRGISFVIDLGTGESEVAKQILAKRFNLKLNNVPLGKVLDFILAATATRSRIDEYAVVIMPEGFVNNDMITRSWKVPPDFLSRESINNQQASEDPFEVNQGGRALLAKSLTALEYLRKKGVSFPEGASASFIAGSSTLRVRNTRSNIDFVDQVVASIIEQQPVVVEVEVRFIKTSVDVLEELGFDWLVTNFGLNNDVYLGGGTTGNGTPFLDYGAPGFNPITSGNRSGRETSNNNTIDGILNRKRTSGTELDSAVRAPGILSLVGAWNDEQVAVLMRGLSNHKGKDWVVRKSVVTRSGQSAILESVQDIIVPTEYEPPEIPNNIGGGDFGDLQNGQGGGGGISFATPATPSAFETRKAGCILEVEPLVGPQRQYVELALKPEVRSFDGFVDYGTPITGGSSSTGFNVAGIGNPNIPTFTQSGSFGEVTANSILMPVFSVTRSNANLIIADGSTVVLGGLLQESRLKTEDKVPFWGDLPLVGRLFQSETESSIRDSLVILVKVRLMDPSGQPYRER